MAASLITQRQQKLKSVAYAEAKQSPASLVAPSFGASNQQVMANLANQLALAPAALTKRKHEDDEDAPPAKQTKTTAPTTKPLPPRDGQGNAYYGTTEDDYARWLPLMRTMDERERRERFQERWIFDVLSLHHPVLYHELAVTPGAKWPDTWLSEATREYDRVQSLWHVQRKRQMAEPWVKGQPIATRTYLDQMRFQEPAKLTRTLAIPEKGLAANEIEARRLVAEERKRELARYRAEREEALAAIERAKARAAEEAKEAKAPPALTRAPSEVGPNGETSETHEKVYSREASGAGKGQTNLLKRWVPRVEREPSKDWGN